MRINTNIASLVAQRNLANTTRAFARSLERLSSGKRINRAGDDAAGLAISEQLNAQVRGMNRAALNVNEAFGFLNTADGALSIQIDIVQRMRELALQASNGTMSVTEREYLNDEFQTLLTEFDRISEQAEFNGTKLLDGTLSTISLQVGTQKGEEIEISMQESNSSIIFENETLSTTVEGLGTFTQTQNLSSGGTTAYGVTAGDFNEDGYDDLIVSNILNNEAARLYFGSADGSFTSSNLTAWTGSIQTGDFNGDDHLDIAFTSSATEIAIRLGDGNGGFSAITTFTHSLGATPVWMTLGDVNDDQELDIIVSASSLSHASISLGDGNGGFSFSSTLSLNANVNKVVIADMDNDGFNDIVANTNGAGIQLAYGNGDGTFGASANVSNDSGWGGLEIGDLNGDGHLDIIGPRFFNLSNGNGTFGANQVLLGDIGVHAQGILIRDLNEDGYLDIIKSNSNYFRIGFGNASTNYTTYSQYTISGSGSLHDSALGDFNGDGALDISGLGLTSDQAHILFQDTEITTTGVSVDLSLIDRENSQDLLDVLDSGLQELLARRASLGAQMNRLEYAESNLRIGIENLSSARSRIIDADIAEETAELTRSQILQQAGVSVLGQANTSLQIVLGLLRF